MLKEVWISYLMTVLITLAKMEKPSKLMRITKKD